MQDGKSMIKLDILLINDRDHEIRSSHSNHKGIEVGIDVLQVLEPLISIILGIDHIVKFKVLNSSQFVERVREVLLGMELRLNHEVCILETKSIQYELTLRKGKKCILYRKDEVKLVLKLDVLWIGSKS